MMLLALLLLVFLLSAGLYRFIIVNQGVLGYNDGRTRVYFIAYAWVVCVLLAGLGVAWHLGVFNTFGSPAIDDLKERRLVHHGYYVGADGAFRFSGTATGEGFQHDAFGPDEFLTLTPHVERPDQRPGEAGLRTWTMATNATSLPLRFDGHCVNLPAAAWMRSGSVLTIVDETREPAPFLSIRWEEDTTWLGARTNAYFFSSGYRLPSGQDSTVYDGVLLTDRVYRESRELATMLRRAPAAFTSQVRVDPRWLEMAQGITLVRQKLGDAGSPMGVLVTRRFYEDDEGRPRRYVAELHGTALTYARTSGVSDTTVTAGTQITYGFTGYRNLLALDPLPDSLMLDKRNSYVVPLSFKRKQNWALPHEKDGDVWQLKSPFIVTSSSAYTELPSYVINTVGASFPFYVKVSVPDADEADVLHVNDGRRNTLVGLDEIVSLGGRAHGALLAYRPAQAPKPRVLGIPLTAHVGFWAIFFLILSTAGFHVLLRLEAGWCQRFKLDLAFVLIWAMVLTILVVRLILSYRIALLPPENATAGEITFVFHKSFVASFWALAVLPLSLLAARLLFMARWNLIDRLTKPLGGLTDKFKETAASLGGRLPGPLAALGRHWMLWLPPWLWIGLGLVFGANESLFGIRISIGLHLLLVIGLFFSFTKIIRDDRPREAWLAFVLASVAILGCMFVIKDYGFFIYLFSFVGCFLMFALRNYTLGTRDEFGRLRMTRTWGVLALIIVIPLAISIVPRLGGLADFVGEIDPQGNVFYRITSYNDTEEAVLLGTGDEREYSPVQLLRNSYQNWQMMLYATEGSIRPHGYGGAVLSDAGMTYPTSITDTAYSVYLLSEHGALVSVLFLLLYLGLCFGCIYGGWLLAQKDLARTLILFLIGAYFACNALYMAAANLGLVFFTGQNIPLLGLYSGADVLQAMVLLVVVTVLLHKDIEHEGNASVEMTMAEHRGMETAQRWFVRVLGVLVLLLLVRMWTLPERYLKNHNFSNDLFRVVSDRDWVYDEETGRIMVAVENDNLGPLRRIEEIYRQQFNNRLDKTAENGGLYYVIPIEDRGRVVDYEVRVNRFLFTLVSPFKDRALWRGTVLARGDEALPTLSTLGTEFQVRLDTLGLPATIRFAQTPDDKVAGSALKLVDRRRQSIFELERDGNDIILEDAGKNWSVFRNGAPIEGRVRLAKHDIIAVTGDEGQQQAFLYLGMQPPILGATEWRNGRWQYVYPGGKEFPSVYTLMEAGRQAHLLAAADEVDAPEDTLNLSLDVRLHRDLQTAMATYTRQNPTYRAGDPLRTNRLAFTVLDAFTGEVLALPAWPLPDPNAPEFDELLRTASPVRQLRLLQNHNFRRHVIGSTTKPVLFTSIAAELWDEEAAEPVDLATMSVRARGEPGRVVQGKSMKLAHDSLGSLPLGSPWDSDRNNNEQVIDQRSFIYQSLNYYMGIVGMIGMIPDRRYFTDVLSPVSSASSASWASSSSSAWPYRDVLYDGQWRRLDMKRLPPSETPFTIEDLPRAPRILNLRVRNTLLWQGLRDNYDVLISGVDVGASREALRDSVLTRTVERFLPIFNQGRASTQNRFLNEAMPDPMVLDPRLWDGYLREDLVSFFLGGGINLWSNVAMAEAGARLATGRRIEARLERRTDDPDFDDMPLPLRDSTWRNTRILSPMQDAGRITGLGQGTAQVILARVQAGLRQRGINPARYRIVFKTGTLQEREPDDPRSEMLLCIVGEWEGTEEAGRFVPGRTLSSFLYMQESRTSATYHRNDLAPPLIIGMIEHLEYTRAEAARRAKAAGAEAVN